MSAISQEEAAELQSRYHAQRRAHAADPENGLYPWPEPGAEGEAE